MIRPTTSQHNSLQQSTPEAGRTLKMGAETTHTLNEGTSPSEDAIPETHDAPPQETIIVELDSQMGNDETPRDSTTAPETTDSIPEKQSDEVHMCTTTAGHGSNDGKHCTEMEWGDGITQQHTEAINTGPNLESPKPTKKLRTDRDRGVPRERTRSKMRHSMSFSAYPTFIQREQQCYKSQSRALQTPETSNNT
jgi:hypothetical protein